MSRPFSPPDPKDRSVNAPSVVVSQAQVLGYYNQENNEDKRERVVDSVKEWYVRKMLDTGWAQADFHGSQCVLVASVQLGE